MTTEALAEIKLNVMLCNDPGHLKKFKKGYLLVDVSEL